MDLACKQITVLILFYFIFSSVRSTEITIVDTRDATAETGFTISDKGWNEVSESYDDGADRRTFQICKIFESNPNYWFRTYYLPTYDAQTIYIEIKFAIRSCRGLKTKHLLSCKETFNIFYLPSDEKDDRIADQMNVNTYTKLQTVAADERFNEKADIGNKTEVPIFNVKSKGIYIAVQNTGGCMTVMHLRVYYKVCDEIVKDLVKFPKTNTGPDRVALKSVAGQCIDNAKLSEKTNGPTLICNSEGSWLLPTGSKCLCSSGFEPNKEMDQCIECLRGNYKDDVGNNPCSPCPAYSYSQNPASTICHCESGFYRNPNDSPNSRCTKPPSEPNQLQATVNKTVVQLIWTGPLETGGRDDVEYEVDCEVCNSKYEICSSCGNKIRFFPSSKRLDETNVQISNLLSHNYYRFKVFSFNGVSMMSSLPAKFAEVRVKTNEAVPGRILFVRVTLITANGAFLQWDVPKSKSPILGYEVKSTSIFKTTNNFTDDTTMKLTNLSPSTSYTIMVRANSIAGFSIFSNPTVFTTRSLSEITHFSIINNHKSSPKNNDSNDKNSLSNQTESSQNKERILFVVALICTLVFITLCVFFIAVNRRKKKYQRAKSDDSSVDLEIYPGFSDTSGTNSRSYVDPCTYEDPFIALHEFTKEIEISNVNIDHVIGGGEFGEVCQGSLLPCGKQVAIKRLKNGYSNLEKKNFLGEASIMGQFDHPHVIRLEGVISRSRPFMIITEYMQNGSLDTFLRENSQSMSSIAITKMLYQIASGMKYLSSMGYVHRDLAARNILLDRRLSCKISDFGLSRVLEEVSDDHIATYMTRGGMIPIRWTAIEAITKRTFTSSSDVWSYGIVMWEVLTFGERPYWDLLNKDVIQLIEYGYRLPPPRACPKVLHTLMLDCWKYDRLERPTFTELMNILNHFVSEPDVLGSCLNCRSACEQEYCIPDVLDVASLGQWLQQMGLLHFKPVMLQYGCVTAEQIMRLSSSELELMGVVNTKNIETILRGAVKLRHKIAEVNHVGIPV